MSHDINDDLFDWNDVKAKYDWSSILIGNGFSQNIWKKFGYESLYNDAFHTSGAHFSRKDIALFEGLKTKNFETVLSAISISMVVAKSLEEKWDYIEEREKSIRAALIQAVRDVHVPWKSVHTSVLEPVRKELSRYSSIFTTNYDLLIYWSIMLKPDDFRDYFWAEGFDIANTKIRGKKTKTPLSSRWVASI